MAQQMDDEFPLKKRGKYDWDNWADGTTWLIERGKDYSVSDSAFQAAAYQAARRRGLELRTAVHGDGVVVEFSPRPKKKLRRKS